MIALLVEDEAMIALSVEEHLRDLGFATVHHAADCTEALAVLDGTTPDFALVDFRLRDGPATPIVARLRDLGVPTVMATGGDARDLPESLRSVSVLAKPYQYAALADVVQRILKTAGFST